MLAFGGAEISRIYARRSKADPAPSLETSVETGRTPNIPVLLGLAPKQGVLRREPSGEDGIGDFSLESMVLGGLF